MIRALITGSLYGDPQARTSQAGKDGASVWCSIIAFGELADRLMTLGNGAALAVSGKAEINGWLDKQGEPKAGLSLVVDELATLKGKPRPPQSAGATRHNGEGEGSPPRPQRASQPPVAAGFDDELPEFM